MTDSNLKPDEAQDALDSVEKMQRAGFGRAAPPRWFSVGVACIVAIGFALYAMEDPGNIPALFIVLGMVLFIAVGREKIAASGKEGPDTKKGMWAIAGVCLFFLALFFGGIAVRRAYDLAWVPLMTGSIAGVTIFLLGESERRYYRMRAAGGVRR